MIGLEKQDNNNLYLVYDDEYSPDRFRVVLNFLDKQRLEILDFSITFKQSFVGMAWDGFNVYPLSLDEDFTEVLSGLNDTYQEMMNDEDSGDVKFELKILCQSRPFDFSLKPTVKSDNVEGLLEDIRHELITTNNLVVCDDETLLDDERFWSLDNKKLISKIDEYL